MMIVFSLQLFNAFCDAESHGYASSKKQPILIEEKTKKAYWVFVTLINLEMDDVFPIIVIKTV